LSQPGNSLRCALQTPFHQVDRKLRSQSAERHSLAFSGPVAAGDLRRFNDATVGRRQTTPIGSFAITAGKFRLPPQRRHGPCKPGIHALNSRPHGCSPFINKLSATTCQGALMEINSKRNSAPEIATQPFAGVGPALIWINAPGR
jgi:hypothetical protein